jgi:hypothetical protein
MVFAERVVCGGKHRVDTRRVETAVERDRRLFERTRGIGQSALRVRVGDDETVIDQLLALLDRARRGVHQTRNEDQACSDKPAKIHRDLLEAR